MYLADISIQHIKTRSKAGSPEKCFTMHPFENQKGPHAGKFELLRRVKVAGQKPVNRSTHVNQIELIEIYAREMIETFELKLRVKPATEPYPTAPPVKLLSHRDIQAGSIFERYVLAFDSAQPISAGLRSALKKVSIEC